MIIDCIIAFNVTRCAVSRGSTSRHDTACINRNFSDNTDFGGQDPWTQSITPTNNEITTPLYQRGGTPNFSPLSQYPTDNELGSFFGGNLDGSAFNGTNRNSIHSQRPKPKNYLSLDPWMTALDDESLNKLSTAQLMQRLKSHGLPHRGLKHELIERWRTFKTQQKEDSEMVLVD